MIADKTQRGFSVLDFTDRYGVECSLQESSLATEDAIWFGVNESNTRHLVPGEGWVPFKFPEGMEIHSDTRMHLTQGQVKRLLPMLHHFERTGCLPEIEGGFFLTQQYRWKLALEEIHGWRKVGWMVFAMMVGGIFGTLANIGVFP
jgi:hypothetical protein